MFAITPIVISAFISTVIFAIITMIAWRRKQEQFGFYFAMMATCDTFWTAMVTLGYAAVPISLKVFLAILDAWGYITSQAFLLLFALSFAGYERIAETKWMKAIVVFYSISNILLVSTNPWHGLYWTGFIPQADNIVVFVHGPMFAYTVVSGYTLIVSALVIVTVGTSRGSSIMKRQARWLVAALLVDIFLNIAYLTNIIGLPGVDWSSATSSLFGLFVLWALYGDKLLDITPIARNKLINNLSDGMIVLDQQNRITDINRSAAEMFGKTEGTLLGKRIQDVLPLMQTHVEQPLGNEVKFELHFDDGSQRYYDALLSPLKETLPNRIIGRMIIFRDITERKMNELRLLQLHKAVEQSPVSVMITDTQGNIEYVNPHFTYLTGYELEEVLGKNPRIVQSGNTSSETYKNMWGTIQSGKIWRGEILNKKKNGEPYWEAEIIAPVVDGIGRIINYITIKEDITAQKESDAKLRDAYTKLGEQMKEIQGLQGDLREQAIRDSLTRLHNRHYLNETLKRELSRAMRESYPISFVLLDIDRFKNINDTYGHDVGDIILRKTADRFSEFTRTGDILCRYGGEEFLVVLPNTHEQDAFIIAERLRYSIQESTINVEGKTVSITISIGISEFPAHGQHENQVLQAADKAMYHAKNSGRNQVVLWSKIKTQS
ncbi:MAG: diguanylate cyclase [Anaerolineales bacterium]|nr:diguanylate cyclase [Anaerolineales bacterium]